MHWTSWNWWYRALRVWFIRCMATRRVTCPISKSAGFGTVPPRLCLEKLWTSPSISLRWVVNYITCLFKDPHCNFGAQSVRTFVKLAHNQNWLLLRVDHRLQLLGAGLTNSRVQGLERERPEPWLWLAVHPPPLLDPTPTPSLCLSAGGDHSPLRLIKYSCWGATTSNFIPVTLDLHLLCSPECKFWGSITKVPNNTFCLI